MTRLSSRIGAALLASVLCWAQAAAQTPYRISPGDVLSLTVVGVPDLAAKVEVGADGTVTLPLAGAIPAEGMTLAEVTDKVRAILPRSGLSRRLDDGRELPVLIKPAQVTLSIVEYRPVYLTGDIAKPGQVTFRPGMTIRQAVALAGGFDLTRFKFDNPILQLSDLKGEYDALWVDHVKQQVLVERLQAERDGRQSLDPKALENLPKIPGVTDAIVRNEQRQLDLRKGDVNKERTYLTGATDKEVERGKLLGQQQVNEQEGAKSDNADLQRFEELFKKGAVALPAVTEARRSVLESATRVLQTTSLLASVQREEGDLGRRLERLDDQRQMQVLHDLEEATAQLGVTHAKLQAISTKMRLVGLNKSQLSRDYDSQVRLNVTRVVKGQPSSMTAEPDAPVEPGDVVEVSLLTSDTIGADR